MMLRSLKFGRSLIQRRFSVMPTQKAVYGPHNTLVLRELAPSVTASDIKSLVEGMQIRKVELQPGCVLHLSNEASATAVASLLENKYGVQTTVNSTLMPTIHLKNISPQTTVSSMLSAFEKFSPKLGAVSGGHAMQVIVSSDTDALDVSNSLRQLNFDNESLQTSIVKVDDSKYVVQVFNLSNGTLSESVQQSITSHLKNSFSSAQVKFFNGGAKTLNLRFPPRTDKEEVSKILHQILGDNQDVLISQGQSWKIPCLHIRQTKDVSIEAIRTLVHNFGAQEVRFSYRSPDVRNDLVIATFPSEESAYEALTKLKGTSIQGHKLNFTYRSCSIPSITVDNIPDFFTEEDVRNLLPQIAIESVEMNDVVPPPEEARRRYRTATVVLTDMKDLEVSVMKIDRQVVDGMTLSASETPIEDLGFSVQFPNDNKEMEAKFNGLWKQLLEAGYPAKSASYQSHIDGTVGFLRLHDAVEAHHQLLKGGVSIASSSSYSPSSFVSNRLTSSVSSSPSFAVEVSGLSVDTPVSEIEALIASSSSSPYFLSSDRSALVKVKRSTFLAPTLKHLRKQSVGGKKVKVDRYSEEVVEGNSEYDAPHSLDEYDRFALRTLLQDNLQSDPATRYRIAKNQFERALSDAQTYRDIEYLLDPKRSSPSMIEEARTLLSSPVLTKDITQRLFDLYLQRDDLLTFAADFRNMTTLFGEADEGDALNWSQFDIANTDDLERITQAIRARELDLQYGVGVGKSMKEYFEDVEKKASAKVKKVKKVNEEEVQGTILPEDDFNSDFDVEYKREDAAPMSESSAEHQAFVDELTEVDSEDAEGAPIKIAIRNGKEENDDDADQARELVDDSGRPWSGVILHMDVVQRTLPQNRINAHRALVAVGNLRGVAGFGSGKGRTPMDATNAAFRAAMRNLVFVDLYDNAGFAHDLFGKHNSCRCYIRATPRDRLLVGSTFAEHVLQLFGVSSASVKFIGRRNPYSMCNAIFEAVANHRNLDEIAKSRGKRFLTLKWMYDHNI